MPTARTTRFVPTAMLALALLCAPEAASAQWPPDTLRNLQVLPADIPVRDLVEMMAGFTRALGVRCTFCHVGSENIPLAEYDFAADDRTGKRKARVMIEMVRAINDVQLVKLENRVSPALAVECITCHRGTRQPRMLQDILVQRWESGGIDSTLAIYDRLRRQNYGGFAYDFGEVPLVDAAADLAARNAIPDAIRLLELNVEMNPTSVFARTQYINLALGDAFGTRGVDAGRALYADMRERFGAAAFPEQLLNAIGYAMLRRQAVDEAIAVFQLNVEAWPESANVYDSLGEAQAAKGDVAAAIRSYERSLELDPGNTNAVEKLRALRGRDPQLRALARAGSR